MQIKAENNTLRQECVLFKQEIQRLTMQLKKMQAQAHTQAADKNATVASAQVVPHAATDAGSKASGSSVAHPAKQHQALAGFGGRSVRKSMLMHEEVDDEDN